MMSGPFSFRLLHTDAHCAARRSVFSTPHGDINLPAFMPVGTQATVKGLEIEQLRATGAEMVLGNTYHLTLRPGGGCRCGPGRTAPLHGLGRTNFDG